MLLRFVILAIAPMVCLACCVAEAPVDLDPHLQLPQTGIRLTLVAENPDIVTPTGIDVDEAGRVWAIASHTHFRPENYEGPEHDEVVVIDTDASRRNGSRHVFYAKTDATMDLELGQEGWVYLAERDRILRVRDSDGDGRGDQEEELAVLVTEADYPHNGLSGLAWHPSGDLVFSLGENYWKPWTLTGRDGRAVAGTGEGGVFRCTADGMSLRRIARGFWNPFGICVREDGTIFAAENDPGAMPPCRLLHVVDGGDYGFQRHYGNAPFHPFVCWNGELPGTLPMLHSLGEAPCGIAPLGNGLIVPSWTDHRIDYYPLTAQRRELHHQTHHVGSRRRLLSAHLHHSAFTDGFLSERLGVRLLRITRPWADLETGNRSRGSRLDWGNESSRRPIRLQRPRRNCATAGRRIRTNNCSSLRGTRIHSSAARRLMRCRCERLRTAKRRPADWTFGTASHCCLHFESPIRRTRRGFVFS